ncbi:MAG: hypothetical protein LIP77_03105, partial [Planctomycetes bacterium]|nr:hypothetical protein [Planctomycetota bacterium]
FSAAANAESRRLGDRVRELTEVVDSSGATMFSRLRKMANNLVNRTQNLEEAARLAEEDKRIREKVVMFSREMTYVQKLLIREFWRVYSRVVEHYIPRSQTMPMVVRAFLRYGVIGFNPWWMRDEVRDHIVLDCSDNILHGLKTGLEEINVLYADEYLAAVYNMECTPSPDEEILAGDKTSIEWKSDRAYRRVINSRSYSALIREKLGDLDKRLKTLEAGIAGLGGKIRAVNAKPFASREGVQGWEKEQEALNIRRANLVKHIQNLGGEVLDQIREGREESERRFLNGELELPDAASILLRECRLMAEASHRMAGGREYFLPLMVRERFLLADEVVNDRDTVAATIQGIERRDPGIFLKTLVHAKKRANRITMRMSPTVIIIPAAGLSGVCAAPREGMEGGHLIIPTCFAKEGIRSKQFANLFADYRWESSRCEAGLDIMTSDTLAGTFMKMRWEWRNQPKEKREKALIINELTDAANWRRIYELYLSDSLEGGRRLFLRNPDCYRAIIGNYMDLPEGVSPLQ